MKKYSEFGLAFPKPFLLRKGANPVFYVEPNSYAFADGPFVAPEPILDQLHDALISDTLTRGLLFEVTAYNIVDFIYAILAILKEIEEFKVADRNDQARIQGVRQKIKLTLNLDEQSCDDLFKILRNNDVLQYIVHQFYHFFVSNFFGFMKVFDSKLSEDDMNNYYMEREWRVVGNIHFHINDVERVILPREFASQFRADFPDYSGQIHFSDSL